jgi:sec-independent protein translocase protein TatC
LFAFAAVAVPLPDPFTMTGMGLALSSLYFGAVLFAYLNDRRRARLHRNQFGDLSDDQVSPLEYGVDQVEAGEPIGPIEPVEPPEPVSRSRFDDMT